MASTSKCPYCGSTLRSDQAACPNCGAPNELYVPPSPHTVFQPRTIEELQQYCAERGMPLLRMRFFIGEDCREPRAFGIYRDGRDVVVYKNKSDGSRAVRYRGPDEEHGVHELYLKLLDECRNRGIYPDGRPQQTRASSAGGSGRDGAPSSSRGSAGGLWSRMSSIQRIIAIIALILLVNALAKSCAHINDGYYRVPGSERIYYHYGSLWYYSLADDYGNDWYVADSGPAGNYSDYRLGDDWDSDWGVGDFKDSGAYAYARSSSSSSSSYDDDDDWDWDSWDSGDTDWDSDW